MWSGEMIVPEAVGRRKCAEKTARGNRYMQKREAKRAAASMRAATGDPIHLFRCRHCGFYHLGRDAAAFGERDEQEDRPRAG